MSSCSCWRGEEFLVLVASRIAMSRIAVLPVWPVSSRIAVRLHAAASLDTFKKLATRRRTCRVDAVSARNCSDDSTRMFLRGQCSSHEASSYFILFYFILFYFIIGIGIIHCVLSSSHEASSYFILFYFMISIGIIYYVINIFCTTS
jgi:hypothetical protein